jgi:spermidine synthase
MDITPRFYYLRFATAIANHMKPRIIHAQTTLPDGNSLELMEHDGRFFLQSHGQQLSGAATLLAEQELARLATHPFRPARQPKMMVLGLGLGNLVKNLAIAIPQKKAEFTVYEPIRDLAQWQKQFFPDDHCLIDSRVRCIHDLSISALARQQGGLHAILVQADACPLDQGKTLLDDRRWLAAMRDALQGGGVLGITAARIIPGMFSRLRRAGFEVVEHFVEVNPGSKRPRRNPIWLARKPANHAAKSFD